MDSKHHYTNSPETVYVCVLRATLGAAFGSEVPALLVAGKRVWQGRTAPSWIHLLLPPKSPAVLTRTIHRTAETLPRVPRTARFFLSFAVLLVFHLKGAGKGAEVAEAKTEPLRQ